MTIFLVYIVCPNPALSLDSLTSCPPSVQCSVHFHTQFKTSPPCKGAVFSFYIPLHYFYENDAINLLHARRYITKYIEGIMGSFRDYNGGLFEKQQLHFEMLKFHLSDKIPDFYLFAEKVFYALQPLEKQISLSIEEAEALLKTFSEAMKAKESISSQIHPTGILVVKTSNSSDLLRLSSKAKECDCGTYAQVHLAGFHYFCFLDTTKKYIYQLRALLKSPASPHEKKLSLQLFFQDGAPLSLNPHYFAKDMRCKLIGKLLFEGLTRLNEEGIPVLAGAEHMRCSQDKLSYTFTLRPHRWSNGEKVSAFHYVQAWKQALLSPYGGNRSDVFLIIKNAKDVKQGRCSQKDLGVKAINAQTLEIQLERPIPSFLEYLSHHFFSPRSGAGQEPKYFNGPYHVHKLDATSLILERNPYFWDYSKIFFQQIYIRWESDANRILSMFQDGQIDWIGEPFSRLSRQDIDYLQNKGSLKLQKAARCFWLYLNTKCLPLSSRLIRRALSFAIDRSTITKNFLIGDLPLYTPLPCSLASFSTNPLKQDVDRARELFEEGLKEIGLTKETCPPLKIYYYNGHKLLAQYLKQTWERIFGISVTFQGHSWDNFCTFLQKGKFQVGGCSESIFHCDALELLEHFQRSSHISGWSDTAYEQTISQARQETEPNQRAQVLKSVENILLKSMPFIPIANRQHLYSHHRLLKGYVFDHSGCVDFRYAYLKD